MTTGSRGGGGATPQTSRASPHGGGRAIPQTPRERVGSGFVRTAPGGSSPGGSSGAQSSGLVGFVVTVLGVGNPIMGDDGVGLELLAGVQSRCGDVRHGDCRVEYVDGGTGGMELLPVVQDASRLLILDAVAGSAPGQVKVLSGDQVARMLASKLSPHQVSLLDVFAAARLLGTEPDTVVVVGVVPESVRVRLGLSDLVAAAVPEAVDRAVGVLADWLADQSPIVDPSSGSL